MKAGLILGVATGVPAFLCLLFGLDMAASAFASLFVGVALSLACGQLLQRARAGLAAFMWVIGGLLVGVLQGVVAAMASGEQELGLGIISFLAPIFLGIWGAVVGAVIGFNEYYRRSDTH